MYGVPAALAIADAVGSGRTSRLTSVVVTAMVVRCQRPSLVRSVAHLWLIPCAAKWVRMTLTPYSASTVMNRWCQSAFNGDSLSSSNCDPPPGGGTGGEAPPPGQPAGTIHPNPFYADHPWLPFLRCPMRRSCYNQRAGSNSDANSLLHPRFSGWSKTELWQVVDVEPMPVFGKF